MPPGDVKEAGSASGKSNDVADDSSRLKDYFDHQPYEDDELFADERVSSISCSRTSVQSQNALNDLSLFSLYVFYNSSDLATFFRRARSRGGIPASS
jgi:hypothetical protein